jgi:uncharacterized protein (DUF1015 family)
MAQIQPFQSIRPVKNKVCIVPSFSYENYTQHEINRLIKINPYSFLNVIGSNYIRRLPKDKKYKAIRKQYEKFKRKKILTQDYLPFLYVLRITDILGNTFTGLVGLSAVEDYDQGKILRHEKTLKTRVKTFAEYLKNVRIQSEPVMLTYTPDADINRLINKITQQVPEYEFSMTEGTVFEMWLVSDFDIIKNIKNAFDKIDKLYIADGHHRAESTSEMRKWMKENNPYHTGNEAYNYLLSFFIASDQLKIYPFHRGLNSLNGLDKQSFLKALSEKFPIERVQNYSEPARHQMLLYLDGEYYLINIPRKLLAGHRTDVDVLNDEIIKEILKIDDPRKNNVIKYHQGKFGLKCVMKSIREKKCRGTFFLHPLTFSEIQNIADRGKTLPPKSTYIDPKLLTGLLIYEF